MAERSVSVRLGARVDAYVAAMRTARAETTGFTRSTERNLRQVGTQMQTMGRRMTMAVTAPLVAAAASAVKLSMDFDTSMTRIQTLVGLSADEVDGMRSAVLGLSGETARSPKELADAMFFVTSAGLSGSEALDVLEASSKAAAVGLGDARTIADLTTSAMNAYGSDVLSAAEATDVLMGAVRLGKLEPDQLAGAMGRVLPIASALGVEFDEVGAAFAAMSRTGTSANEAATQLRGILVTILSPSQQARAALADVGLSADGLQRSLREDGLLATLELMRDRFGGNTTAMEAVFGNVRALSGVMDMLGANVEDTRRIFGQMADTAGMVDAAFDIVSQTAGFKMQRAFAELQVALIGLGDIMLPIVSRLADGVGDAASAFAGLPAPVRAAGLALGAVAATAGPMVFVAGSLVRNYVDLRAAFSRLSGPGRMAAGALGGVALAATAAFLVYQQMTKGQRATEENTRQSTRALLDQFPALMGAALAAAEASGEVDALAVANTALSRSLADGNDELVRSAAALNISQDEILDILVAVDGTAAGYVTTLDNVGRKYGFTAEQAHIFANNAIVGMTDSTMSSEELRSALDLTEDEFRALMGATNAFMQAANQTEIDDIVRDFLDLQVAAAGYEGSLVAAAEANTGFSRSGENAVAVYEEWARLVSQASDETLDALGITEDMAAAMAALDFEALAGEVDGLGDGFADAAGGLAEFETVAASSIETTSELTRKMDDARTIAGFFTSALNDTVDPMRNLVKAGDAVYRNMVTFSDQIDENNRSVERNTEEGLKNRAAIFGWADDIVQLSQRQIEAGMHVDEVSAAYAHNRKALLDAAEAADFNREEVDRLITTYGLTPELITTTIELRDVALQEWRIGRYLNELGEIPESVATRIEAMIDRGQYSRAEGELAWLQRKREVPIEVRITNPRIGISSRGTAGFGVHAVAAADGGFFHRPTLAHIGEAGDEVALPLTRPHRMDALLGDPRALDPVLESLARIGKLSPMPMTMTGSMGSSGGSSGASLTTGDIYVGSRDDGAAMLNKLDELRWRAGVAA